VAGLDEAGRGPWAGPVVAAAVVLPRAAVFVGLNDSKQVPEAERERLYKEIRARAAAVGIGLASEREIDQTDILEATRLAMHRAVRAAIPVPDFLLIDAVTLPNLPMPQRAVIKGDALSLSIAAASIIAKVTRDRLMADYHRAYPHYNFLAHKGYGTAEHLRLLKEHGPCAIHRLSFRPVQECLAQGAGASPRSGASTRVG
jgi:ribonuclease HII